MRAGFFQPGAQSVMFFPRWPTVQPDCSSSFRKAGISAGFRASAFVDCSAQQLPVRRFGLIAQPFVVALSMGFWILHDGVTVLNADGVAEPPHRTKEIQTGSAMGDGQHALVIILFHDAGQGFDHLTFCHPFISCLCSTKSSPGARA